MAFNPREVFAWDDAGHNRWLISEKGSGIMNPPSAWAVAKRDNPQVAAQCWPRDVPRGPNDRFVGQRPFFYGLFLAQQASGQRSFGAYGSVAGAPARPDMIAQIYTQALQTVMVARVTQEGRSIDAVLKWPHQEPEG